MTTTNGKTKTNNDSKWGTKLVTETKFLKTSSLEDGQSVEGTVVAFKESTIPSTGKKVINMVFKLANGETRTISPSGNVAYAIKDGLFEVGKTYKIQREGTKKIKGMDSGVFGIYPLRGDAKASDLNQSDNSDI